jgi:hypothetical protein
MPLEIKDLRQVLSKGSIAILAKERVRSLDGRTLRETIIVAVKPLTTELCCKYPCKDFNKGDETSKTGKDILSLPCFQRH